MDGSKVTVQIFDILPRSRDIYVQSFIFTSIIVPIILMLEKSLSNSTMLSKLVMHPNDITYFTERLIMQSTFNSRQLGTLRFFHMSTKRVGKSSFVNRAKDICEAIPFDWPDISHQSFKRKIKESTPLLLRD